MKQKIFVTGHLGMVGSALCRQAMKLGGYQLLTQTRSQLDLTDQSRVFSYLRESCPDIVIVAAAKVGGIHANATYPAEFIYENLAVATNLIEGSYRAGVKRVLFLGSSCIYPKNAIQPMSESSLLTSELEPTNEAYAIAKIAGLKMCQYYRKQYGVCYHSAMPTNLYGPGDNYHSQNSHVIPGMIRRFHDARVQNSQEVTIWGTGKPHREFLYVDDMAEACFHLLNLENPPDWVNVGCGEDLSIIDLARLVADTVGYQGAILTDSSRPDGTPRKLLDVSSLKSTGWAPRTNLINGLKIAYKDFLDKQESGKVRM
ncbi:MAG: GDP-L-fucose synthase family protein [Verrucomicrobiales bacterium]